jgi:pyrimidine-nucleoside phosphorylase
LADVMIKLAADHDCNCVALVTAMDRPLGRACGNALEVEEAIAALKGEGPADRMSLTYALGAEMLVLAGAAPDLDSARRELEKSIGTGRAAQTFQRIIEAQGGNPSVVDDPAVLPQAVECEIYPAPRRGSSRASSRRRSAGEYGSAAGGRASETSSAQRSGSSSPNCLCALGRAASAPATIFANREGISSRTPGALRARSSSPTRGGRSR